MIRRLLLLLCFSLIAACTEQSAGRRLAVQNIANCGYLIETEHKAVIIDGLLAPVEGDLQLQTNRQCCISDARRTTTV